MNYISIFLIYILIINIIGYTLMYLDKRKAIKHTYRISEKTFFIISFLFGATGVYLGIYKFRHKTKHYSFTVLVPALIILNLFFVIYILNYLLNMA